MSCSLHLFFYYYNSYDNYCNVFVAILYGYKRVDCNHGYKVTTTKLKYSQL